MTVVIIAAGLLELTLDNMAWVVTDDLAHPDSLLRATYQLIEHNPSILGSSATCIPYFFPQKGRCIKPILEQCTALCPMDILTRVTDAVHNYVMDAEQSDDLTLLAIHYTPSV